MTADLRGEAACNGLGWCVKRDAAPLGEPYCDGAGRCVKGYAARPVGGDTRETLREDAGRAMWNALPATPHGWDLVSDGDRSTWLRIADTVLALPAVRDALDAQETVRQLHRQTDGGWCAHCGDISDGGHGIWPCDTIRALAGDR
jgi:hypothetical protein